MNGIAACRPWAAIVLLCAGCSGAPTDPFSRVTVTGTVTLDGQPIRWGSVTLKGEKNEATQEQAFASFAVRDGKIVEEAGAPGTTAGLNEVSVIVYETDPADESREPVIKGTWLGQLEIKAGQPLEIKMDSSSLEKPTPNL
jgi:hypothetical protein